MQNLNPKIYRIDLHSPREFPNFSAMIFSSWSINNIIVMVSTSRVAVKELYCGPSYLPTVNRRTIIGHS